VEQSFIYTQTPSVPPSPLRKTKGKTNLSWSKCERQLYPLETQEIILFSMVNFILKLVSESHQARSLLRAESVEYLTSIMSVFNILCPRPLEDKNGDKFDARVKLLPHEYGPLRYEMSENTWLLFVLTRISVEDIIKLLQLDSVIALVCTKNNDYDLVS
jgi:hypothetical protein